MMEHPKGTRARFTITVNEIEIEPGPVVLGALHSEAQEWLTESLDAIAALNFNPRRRDHESRLDSIRLIGALRDAWMATEMLGYFHDLEGDEA